MSSSWLTLATIFFTTLASPAVAQRDDDRAEIRRVAMRQADTWNRHDAKANARWTMDGARTPAGIPEPREGIPVPTLLGAGERLFGGVTDLKSLQPVQTIAAPDVTHLKFARR